MTSDPETTTPLGGEVGEEKQPAEMDMAALLEGSLEYRSPQRGEVVEGVLMGWDRDGALVDIGAKSEGVIPRHEMQSLGSDAESQLRQGEKVLVFIIQPDTADGQVMLSLDKARGEQGWHTLQERFESGEAFEAAVTGYNKGGLLVHVEGVNAFVPLSQVVGVRPDRGDDRSSSLAESVGRTLQLKVIEINRRRNRVILSERAALQEWRLKQKERLIKELHEGDIRRGRISSVRSFGVFVDLGGADGLAHLSELSWERDKSPSELFNVGDEVDVYVTKIDAENKKIALSLRRANPEQWDNVVDNYKEGQVVTGLVTKLVAFGAFARIEGPVEGLIHVSELVDRRIGHPKEVVREGDLLPLKIVRIERDRHRLGLSLRRSRDEGEVMGFVFSDGGEVLSVPDDIRAEFEAREGPLPTPVVDEETQAAEPVTTVEPTEAVAEEPVATEQPEAAAEEPAATEEPEAAAEEPAATEEPEAAAEEPVASEEPEAVAEEPAATEEPGAVAEEPVASEEPGAVAEEPAATEEPEAVAEEPVASEEPEAVAEEPVATEEPEAAAEEPAATEEPEAAAEEPAATEEPEAVAEEPAPTEEQAEEEAKDEPPTPEPSASAEDEEEAPSPT